MASKNSRKVIVTCAVTGGGHTPTMSPYLPVTPDQIVDEAVAAANAGASVIHLHARKAENGQPTGDPAVWLDILSRIKQQTNAVLNTTTGGSTYMAIEERLASPLKAQPELASLNLGSMNFGTFVMAPKYSEWKHDWEYGHLENSRDAIFKNTFKDIETILERLGEGCGTRFEFECYDVGHLYTLAHFLDRKLARPPLFIQMVLGPLGGIGPDVENLVHMKRIADKLFGQDFQWSVLAAGRYQIPLATVGAVMGSNVRVGLEDNLYIAPGKLAESNADQVTLIRTVLGNLSMEIATPDETRQMLALKGADQVAF
ncbi:MAG: 3-keto-5-aminohexanoate cleavage protein [Hyphomicrobiales bacterium]